MGQGGAQGIRAFPEKAQFIFLTALTIAAGGGKADIAKLMHGIGSGLFEMGSPSEAMRSV